MSAPELSDNGLVRAALWAVLDRDDGVELADVERYLRDQGDSGQALYETALGPAVDAVQGIVAEHGRRARNLELLAASYPGDWTPDKGGAPMIEMTQGGWAPVARHEGEHWVSSRFTEIDARTWQDENYVLFAVVNLDTGDVHDLARPGHVGKLS